MQYGADYTNYADFKSALTAVPPLNKEILSHGTGLGHVYLGLPRWDNKRWIGSLYPKGTKEQDFLAEYAKKFNALELNATHYIVPSPAQLINWRQQVDHPLFLFCPKFPSQISHYSNLISIEKSTAEFLDGLQNLGENLGPIFLQLGENFKPDKLANLLGYLTILPKDLQFFVEVRNKEWFSNPEMFEHLVTGLSKLRVGLVITDTPGREDLRHMTLTAPKLFLRFVCLGNSPTDERRMENWAQRISTWKDEGLSEAFVFLHLDDLDHAITFSEKVKGMLQIY